MLNNFFPLYISTYLNFSKERNLVMHLVQSVVASPGCGQRVQHFTWHRSHCRDKLNWNICETFVFSTGTVYIFFIITFFWYFCALQDVQKINNAIGPCIIKICSRDHYTWMAFKIYFVNAGNNNGERVNLVATVRSLLSNWLTKNRVTNKAPLLAR